MTVSEDLSIHICILGGGPAGYVAAIRAAQLGGRVTLVEEREVGGTFLNRGCIWWQSSGTSSFCRRASGG